MLVPIEVTYSMIDGEMKVTSKKMAEVSEEQIAEFFMKGFKQYQARERDKK